MCMEYNRRKIYVGRSDERVNITHLQICDVHPVKHLENHIILVNAIDFDNDSKINLFKKNNTYFQSLFIFNWVSKHLQKEIHFIVNLIHTETFATTF